MPASSEVMYKIQAKFTHTYTKVKQYGQKNSSKPLIPSSQRSSIQTFSQPKLCSNSPKKQRVRTSSSEDKNRDTIPKSLTTEIFKISRWITMHQISDLWWLSIEDQKIDMENYLLANFDLYIKFNDNPALCSVLIRERSNRYLHYGPCLELQLTALLLLQVDTGFASIQPPLKPEE